MFRPIARCGDYTTSMKQVLITICAFARFSLTPIFAGKLYELITNALTNVGDLNARVIGLLRLDPFII